MSSSTETNNVFDELLDFETKMYHFLDPQPSELTDGDIPTINVIFKSSFLLSDPVIQSLYCSEPWFPCIRRTQRRRGIGCQRPGTPFQVALFVVWPFLHCPVCPGPAQEIQAPRLSVFVLINWYQHKEFDVLRVQNPLPTLSPPDQQWLRNVPACSSYPRWPERPGTKRWHWEARQERDTAVPESQSGSGAQETPGCGHGRRKTAETDWLQQPGVVDWESDCKCVSTLNFYSEKNKLCVFSI